MNRSLDPRLGQEDPMDNIIVFTTPSKNSVQNEGADSDQVTLLWPPPPNGVIPSPPGLPPIDECPALVSSDEEELEVPRNNEEMVQRWMSMDTGKKVNTRLDQEVRKMVVQGVGLYMLGLETAVPSVWVLAMMEAGIFEDKSSTLDELDERRLLLSDINQEIFTRNQQIFYSKQKKIMKEALDMIDDIEQNGYTSERVPVERALQIATQCTFFHEQWQSLEQLAVVQKYCKEYTKGNQRPILFSLLIFYKLVHHHVIYFGNHKGTKTDQIIKSLHNGTTYNHHIAKEEGRKYFEMKEYTEAVKMYTVAMLKDYGNAVLYGNRAQCFIYLKEYWKAYCDCTRAIFLNPKWFKGYYRRAEACLNMDRLEEALEMNKVAAFHCTDNDKMKADIQKQRQKIIQAQKQKNGISIEAVPENPSRRDRTRSGDFSADPKMADGSVTKNSIGAAQGNTNNSSRDRPKSRTDSDSNRTATGPQSRPQELTDVEKYSLNLREGLEAYNLDNYLRAAGKYQSALNLWSQSPPVKSGVSTAKLVVVRYAFAINAVSQDRMRSLIQEGLQTFQTMHKDVEYKTFPLAAYGLGQALVAFYRFKEALPIVDVGVTKAMRKAWKEESWPESEQTIEESRLTVFLKAIVKLKNLCRFPPPPDAVCFEHVDHDNECKEIYTESPTYGGLVTMSCFKKCRFRFHITCWKEYKGKFSVEKISEKEMVDRACPTPDCDSFIFQIHIERPDKKPVTFISDHRPSKPRGNHKISRMRPSNPDKIARRLERKETRRQKRAEVRQADGRQRTPPQSSPEKTSNSQPDGTEGATSAAPTANAMVVLQKDEKEDTKYNTFHKHARPKKKKTSKNVNVLSVEVNFTDDSERESTRVGEQDAVDEESSVVSNTWSKPPKLPLPLLASQPTEEFAVPPHLREQLESFSNIVAQQPSRNPTRCQKDEEIKQTLIMFLGDFLRAEGPQHLDGPHIHRYLEDIPEEVNRLIKQSGGLRNYFEKHSEFVVVGDHVGDRRDFDKVQSMAEGLYDPPVGSRSMSAQANLYNSDRRILGGSGAIAKTKESERGINSRTSDAPATNGKLTCDVKCTKSVGIEMTLPTVTTDLNPSAPVFQPGQSQGYRERQGTLNFDTDDDTSQLGACSDSSSTRPRSDGIDTLDMFGSGIDDIDGDDEWSEWHEMNNIDDVDVYPSASDSLVDMEDPVADQQSTVPDGMSRRSSRSDLSQTSDLYTGGLFRTNSPSSSTSSHKTASTRDRGSPFGARDTSSPVILPHTARVGDITRKTASPISSVSAFPPAAVSPTFMDQSNSELGLGADFMPYINMPSLHSAGSDCSNFAISKVHEYNRPNGPLEVSSYVNCSSTPKPLQPIGTAKTAGVCNGGESAVISDRVRASAVTESVSSNFSDFPQSSSFLPSSPASSLTSVLSSSFAFPTSISSTWSSLAVPVSDSWVSNSFPTAVRPEEDVVNSIPPFSTSKLFSSSTSSSSVVPPPIPLPSFSQSAWSTVDDWPDTKGGWSTALVQPMPQLEEKVDAEVQASVELRSVEINTDLTERDVGTLLMQQNRLNELYQQMQQMHLHNEKLKAEFKKAQDENRTAQRELEELRQDRSKAVQQMTNLDAELQSKSRIDTKSLDGFVSYLTKTHPNSNRGFLFRVREQQTDKEQQLLTEIQSARDHNNRNVTEISELHQKVAALEEQASMERNRAVRAEVQVVQEQIQNFKMQLESKMKETEIYRQQTFREMQKRQEENQSQSMAELAREVSAYFQQVRQTWLGKLEDITAQLNDQKEQIMGGALLSDLKPVSNVYPQLPRPPEGLVIGPNGQLQFMSPGSDIRQHAAHSHALPAPEISSATPATMATSMAPPGKPIIVGPPGLPMTRPPAPLRPPLARPGMPSASLFPGDSTETSLPRKSLDPAITTPPPLRPLFSSISTLLPKQHPPMEPAKVAPTPLRPISTSKGLAGTQQRALTPPLAAAGVPKPVNMAATLKAAQAGKLGAGAAPKQSSFDRLVQTLQKSFPDCQREDFQRAVHELRQAHHGTLSGMDLELIVRHVTNMLIARGFQVHGSVVAMDGNFNNSNNNNNNSSGEGKRLAPPPGISPVWSVEGLEPLAGSAFVEEEDPCAICHEELSVMPVQTLECGHRFHDPCIRKWFKQQATCPKCRTYAPLLDEYPTLK